MGDSEDRLLSKCIPWASIVGPWAAVLVEEKCLRPVTLLSLFIRDICTSVTSLFLGIWIPGPDWEWGLIGLGLRRQRRAAKFTKLCLDQKLPSSASSTLSEMSQGF